MFFFASGLRAIHNKSRGDTRAGGKQSCKHCRSKVLLFTAFTNKWKLNIVFSFRCKYVRIWLVALIRHVNTKQAKCRHFHSLSVSVASSRKKTWSVRCVYYAFDRVLLLEVATRSSDFNL